MIDRKTILSAVRLVAAVGITVVKIASVFTSSNSNTQHNHDSYYHNNGQSYGYSNPNNMYNYQQPTHYVTTGATPVPTPVQTPVQQPVNSQMTNNNKELTWRDNMNMNANMESRRTYNNYGQYQQCNPMNNNCSYGYGYGYADNANYQNSYNAMPSYEYNNNVTYQNAYNPIQQYGYNNNNVYPTYQSTSSSPYGYGYGYADNANYQNSYNPMQSYGYYNPAQYQNNYASSYKMNQQPQYPYGYYAQNMYNNSDYYGYYNAYNQNAYKQMTSQYNCYNPSSSTSPYGYGYGYADNANYQQNYQQQPKDYSQAAFDALYSKPSTVYPNMTNNPLYQNSSYMYQQQYPTNKPSSWYGNEYNTNYYGKCEGISNDMYGMTPEMIQRQSAPVQQNTANQQPMNYQQNYHPEYSFRQDTEGSNLNWTNQKHFDFPQKMNNIANIEKPKEDPWPAASSIKSNTNTNVSQSYPEIDITAMLGRNIAGPQTNANENEQMISAEYQGVVPFGTYPSAEPSNSIMRPITTMVKNPIGHSIPPKNEIPINV